MYIGWKYAGFKRDELYKIFCNATMEENVQLKCFWIFIWGKRPTNFKQNNFVAIVHNFKTSNDIIALLFVVVLL